MKKRVCGLMGAVLLCGMLTACGNSNGSGADSGGAYVPGMEQESELQNRTEETQRAEEQTGADTETRKIADQSFEVELNPLGKVSFVSYAPDTKSNPKGDVVFTLTKDGGSVTELEGMNADNVRSCYFKSVDAVSFPDYNGDGFNDIITVCSYVLSEDDRDMLVEARIYSADASGNFTLERTLTEEANSALAEKTVASVLGFLGAGTSGRLPASDNWQQAYIDYIKMWENDEAYTGYALIYLDADDIPELVQIGDYEAAGCRIIGWYDGKTYDNQLNRLYFSYIEKENLLCNSEGNMDYYYDLVYRMEKGRLVSVASGFFGAEDNSNVKFDENGERIYRYEWEGTEMSKEEYAKELNKVYDTSKARDGYEWDGRLTAEEMMKQLTKMME